MGKSLEEVGYQTMTFSRSFLFLLFGVVVLLSLVSIPGVTAQEASTPTPSPGPIEVPPLEPACQLYHLTVDQGRVRACASFNCRIVESVNNTSSLCVRGVADNTEWFVVDLLPEDPNSPLYYMHNSILAAGPVGQSEPATCNPFEVSATEATVRQCPSLTCAALGTLPFETWMCARAYGGQYQEWVYIDYSDGQLIGWVHTSLLAPLNTRTPDPNLTLTAIPTAAAVVAGGPTFTPLPVVSVTPQFTQPAPVVPVAQVASPTQPPLPPGVTPTATPTVVGPPPSVTPSATLPVCPTNIPGFIPPPTATRLPTVTPSADTGETPSATSEFTDQIVYIVQPDDTVWDIAIRYDSTIQAIRDANNLDSSLTIIVGQQLIVPVRGTGAAPTATEAAPEAAATAFPFDCVTATPTPILTAQPTRVVEGPLLAQNVSLASLNIRNQELRSPRSSAQFRLDLPLNWLMSGNNILYLNVEYIQSASDITTRPDGSPLTSLFQVYLNDQLISSTTFSTANQGPQTLAIPLPSNIMLNTERRTHTVLMTLAAQDHCLLNLNAQVFMRSDQSYVHFEYQEFLPTLDLAFYPRPFFNNPLAGQIESMVLVLPPQISDADLQAAASVAAGLGLLSGGVLQINVVTADQLTDQDRQNNNLVVIGLPEENPLLASWYDDELFPTHRDSAGNLTFNGVLIEPTDGVVQIIAHPENERRAILAVTGQTTEGLLKAAQSLAGPPSILGLGGPLALIAETRPVARPPAGTTLEALFTLADLGHQDITVNGIGTQLIEIDFNMPPGARLTDDAYVNLLFSSSPVLEGIAQTSVALLMNDIPIGGDLLNNLAATPTTDSIGRRSLRAAIPPNSVVAGERNRLSLSINTNSNFNCNPPDDSVAWFTVFNDSQLNLPRQVTDPALVPPLVGWFPVPFNAQPDLRDVWVSLPTTPTALELQQALDIIARLAASMVNGEGFAPRIHRGELPPDTDLAQYHFIVIGRPTTNPFLNALNEALPQPFVPGTDELRQLLDDVNVRPLPGQEVGVVEILHSPWAAARTILVITGTGPTGQSYAANVIANPIYDRADLQGDVIFVRANSISVVDTRLIVEAEERATAVAESMLDLETQEALAGSATPTTVLVYTVTPGPTLTPTLTRTPGPTDSPTPIFTFTPSPTISTPLPTFSPLPPEVAAPVAPERPQWVDVLLGVTAATLGITGLYGVAQMIRRLTRRGA